jgi:choline monooxygenase
MPTPPFYVDSDVTQAATLPGSFYREARWFEAVRERIFLPAWHFLGNSHALPASQHVQPVNLLPGFMDEPLLLTRDAGDQVHCLSNVCTHRANLLVETGQHCRELRCRYHGRRFALDGHMKHMPEFKEARHFPAETDHLPSLPLRQLGPLLFAQLQTGQDFGAWLQPVLERVGFLPMEEFVPAPQHGRTYLVKAHWALYVDNYLEGFHIPFIHPALNEVVSYPDYRYELFEQGNLQVGIAQAGEATFDLPSDHPDRGQAVAAYYFWLFPNLMLNFYPWGLSLNVVEPISPVETRVRFESYVWKPELYDDGNRDLLHHTELEDEAVVEAVQKGVNARLYQRGRFSPKMEPAVHHFHLLLARGLGQA